MNKNVELIDLDCPICDKVHKVERRKRIANVLIKNEEIQYEEIYYKCTNVDDEENEFVTAKQMDENLLNARNEYRKQKGLLTSDEIESIRKKYEVNQAEFSLMLGWGEITITRYESKLIQDATYDNLIRLIGKDYMFALSCLERNKEKFSEKRYQQIKYKIMNLIKNNSLLYYKMQEIQSKYVAFDEETDINGYKIIDINKINDIIGYIAQKCPNLYKVKLMKFLWYIDAIHYKKYGKSMTGLVYVHMQYGALPIAYDEITYLPNIVTRIEINNDMFKYHIQLSENALINEIKDEEKQIIDLVINKFRDYNTNDLVKYMHKEKAYEQTKMNEIISYELCKELKEF